VNGTGLRLLPLVDFGISGVELSCLTAGDVISLKINYNIILFYCCNKAYLSVVCWKQFNSFKGNVQEGSV
jgi:hypothetical protein